MVFFSTSNLDQSHGFVLKDTTCPDEFTPSIALLMLQIPQEDKQGPAIEETQSKSLERWNPVSSRGLGRRVLLTVIIIRHDGLGK